MLDQAGHQTVGGGVGGADGVLHLPHRHDGFAVEVLEYAVSVRRGAAKPVRDRPAVAFAERENRMRGSRRLLADLQDALQEEGEPGFPGTVVAHGLEMIVVALAVPPEEVGEVKHGLRQGFPLAEHQGDE